MTVQDLPSKVSTPEFEERSVPACIAVICAFAATGMLATNIFLPSLPSMAATLHVSSAAVTSAITVYLAIFAVGQLVVGPLSDRFGRRPVILIGLSLFVAIFAVCTVTAYVSFVGETIQSARSSMNPLTIAGSYLALIRDIRFVVPARTTGLLMVGLFAIFSSAPRLLVESFGFSPIMLGLLFAAIVFVVFAAGMLATRLSARLGLYRATVVGLAITVIGGATLLLAGLVAKGSLLPFITTTAIFLLGLGIASPLSSAAALSPFGNKAGVAAALLGFAQMAGGALGTWLAAAISSDPALGLGIVAALASPLALILCRLGGRASGADRAPERKAASR